MKTMTAVILTAAAALIFAACGAPAPANNAPANTVANTAPPAPAAPTADALLTLDKQANEAYFKHDTKFFETFLNDKFIGFGGTGRWTRDSVMKEIADHKCTVKDGYTLDEPHMTMVGPDTAVLVYKFNGEGTCAGKKIGAARAASVFVRKGDKWLGAYHSETPIVEPKAAAPATAEKKADTKPLSSMAKDANAAKLADAKKPADTKNLSDAKAANSKPADTKAADTSMAATDRANTAAGPSTDALMAVEKAGWEAWKARDAKALGDVTTANISFVDAMGAYMATKDETIKFLTQGKCDIKSVNVTDGESIALSATVAILTYKGTAVGTCDGRKLGPLWGATVFQNDGGTWKAAFIFEKPAS